MARGGPEWCNYKLERPGHQAPIRTGRRCVKKSSHYFRESAERMQTMLCVHGEGRGECGRDRS